jgi:hypothetical protein
MFYRVDIDALCNKLLRIIESGLFVQKINKKTRLLATSQLDGGKAANKKAENQPTSRMETSQHYKGISEITTETTTTTADSPKVVDPQSDTPGTELVETGRRDSIKQILKTTLFSAADPVRIAGAADKYGRSDDDIAMTIDILDQQYRKGKRKVEDPTGLVIAALIDGIVPPELRKYHRALKATAVQLVMARARAPDCSDNNADAPR